MPTIRERVIELLGGVPRNQAQSKAARAYEAGYNDNGEDEPVSGTTKTYGYRRQTAGGLRDFTKLDHRELIEIVWTLYQSNPVAARSLKIKTAYVVGDRLTPQYGSEAVEEVCENFWRKNKLDAGLIKFTHQLFLWGEQCFPVAVRQSDGAVRLGYIDPADIETVISHPNNPIERWAVIVREQISNPMQPWLVSRARRVYRIVREDEGVVVDYNGAPIALQPAHPGKLVTHDQAQYEDWERVMLRAMGLDDYTGSCLLFQVNNVSNQARGFSDLLQVADWIDAEDETLFALADREQMAGYFSWDVKLSGADPQTVAQRSNAIRRNPPRKGSVNVHNDQEEWSFNFPDLKQATSIETANALITRILGGMGLPRHFFGFGDETNRATAQAQHDPTWRTLQMDQAQVREMILTLLAFARDQAIIAGALYALDDDSASIDLIMPAMTSKDVVSMTAALAQLSAALQSAEQAGYMSHEKAVEAWSLAVGELGVEMDAVQDAPLDAPAPATTQAALNVESWFARHAPLSEAEA